MNTHILTCRQAREIDLVYYLASLGHQPQKITNSDYWYCSPLREEKTPSFKVDRKKNLWYDHGIGQGGNLVDFGVLFHKCSVSELLQKLSAGSIQNFSFHPPIKNPGPAAGEKEKVRIIQTRELGSAPLLEYLEKRRIPPEVASLYCREIVFEVNGKRHEAIGFPNNAGGYELRNHYYKGCSAPKGTTFFNREAPCLTVFEGFFSFLSYQVLHPNGALSLTNFLVLNSLSFLERSRSRMDMYLSVRLFLDRDEAGLKATKQALGYGRGYSDQSYRYEAYKDLNEFLLNQYQGPQRSLRFRIGR
ncbi:toprim domain-containing protein [Paraflavisolibacter sp. H34]|uniref:CHC2 zinc finger domain-containing protein n=1 Tax=Huijunlia imazamoxiresistens TaxID=3127457 RepID=UPI00301664B0